MPAGGSSAFIDMTYTRRDFVLASTASLMGLSLAACTTSPTIKVRTYTEQVSTLLLSADGRQLVVLGKQYHYIFSAPPELYRLVHSPLKTHVTAMMDPFDVTLNGTITGAYTLVFNNDDASVSDDDIRALGFQRHEDGRWLLRSKLSGKRYLIGNTLRQGRIHETLQQTYTVTVHAEETLGDKAAEGLVTPVVLTSGGVLLIYYVLLAPIALPILYLTEEKRAPIKETFR
jgi:hypothetical protein